MRPVTGAHVSRWRPRLPGPARVGALFVAACALAAPRAGAETFRPTRDDEVLEVLTRPGGSARPARREATASLKPGDLDAAVAEAARLLAEGQRTRDPRLVGRAQALLGPWWDQPRPPIPVLLLRAYIRQHDHAFAAALDDLAAFLEARPRHPAALRLQASVRQVMGDFAAAKESCAALPADGHAAVAVVCQAWADSFLGRAAAAQRQLQDLLARLPAADEASRVYALTASAEIAQRLGQLADAETRFREVLGLSPDNPFALVTLADTLLARGRPADVLALLDGKTDNDGPLVRMALAAKLQRSPAAPALAATMGEHVALNAQRGSTSHRREEALFLLDIADKPAEALRLAAENWRTQREPADTRLLARAALAAKDGARLAEVVAWRARLGLEDAILDGILAGAKTSPSP